MSLTGISANADVELYDKNRTLITVLNNEGSTPESLSQRLTEIGRYYLKVESKATTGTNYTLTTAFVPDETITTPSGLKYVDLAIGNGNPPRAGQIVTVNYTGVLEDGTQFDSSRDRDRPFSFKIGQGQVIGGWDEGLSTMKVGGRRQLVVPANLAYGSSGIPGSIPPNATLIGFTSSVKPAGHRSVCSSSPLVYRRSMSRRERQEQSLPSYADFKRWAVAVESRSFLLG